MKNLLARLESDRKSLEHELRNVLPREIARAASLGDLSENAEYEAALDRQRLLQSKLRKLKSRISDVSVIDIHRLPADRAAYGAFVELLDLDTDNELTYRLVLPEDADANHRRISMSSPIGRALVGKSEGDEVTIEIPNGTRRFEVLEVTPYRETDQEL